MAKGKAQNPRYSPEMTLGPVKRQAVFKNVSVGKGSQNLPANKTLVTARQNQPTPAELADVAEKTRTGKRNTLLHRFFEPLVLLYVLDRTRGEHISRPGLERLPLGDLSTEELRRNFLDSLSYVCDYKKGGDTVTAIAVASTPLTYYVASNTNPNCRAIPFLRSLLEQLRGLHGLNTRHLNQAENQLVQKCIQFSTKRVKQYWKFLQTPLKRCIVVLSGDSDSEAQCVAEDLSKLEEKCVDLVQLCLQCDLLRKTSAMTYISEKVVASEARGNEESPFRDLRHFIGRLASHVKTVRVLIAASQKLPELFEDFHIEAIQCPTALTAPPIPKNKLNLDGIVNRMIGNNPALTQEVQAHLRELDRNVNVELNVRASFADKNLKPRVHAELILLEHFFKHRDSLQFVANDRYIGCSKPACYCCALYIHHHPGIFIQPATHQTIYLNWMPPTSRDDGSNPDIATSDHERSMLNKMVEKIRKETIEQITTRSGKRKKHFDSVTGETFSVAVFSRAEKEKPRNENTKLSGEADGTTEHAAEMAEMGDRPEDFALDDDAAEMADVEDRPEDFALDDNAAEMADVEDRPEDFALDDDAAEMADVEDRPEDFTLGDDAAFSSDSDADGGVLLDFLNR